MTTPILFREYIWLVNTIYKARKISLSEINEKWVETEMSGGVEFSRTTFHRHKIAIEEMFGIYIECDRKNGFKYYIGNESVLQEDSVQNWMLSTLSVSGLLAESMSLNERILLENIPSGGEKLHVLIKAMKESKKVSITYRRYGGHATRTFDLEPYCVKLFVQRWYLLGRIADKGLATFSLDRILEVKISHEKFKFDEDFNAASYFSNSFGVMLDEKAKPEKVLIRAYGYEPYYLRDLPLHHSQREVQSTEEYCDFELMLKITSDFKSKLLSRGEWIEILEPKALADEIIEWHQNAINRYKKCTQKGQSPLCMDILRKELNEIYQSQHLENEHLDSALLEACKGRVSALVGLNNACAVITDAASDSCYLYGGAFAALLGISEGTSLYKELNSSDEDLIYNRLHPEDLVEKRMLEYEFFKYVDALPGDEKLGYKATCRIRIKGRDGNYIFVNNSTQILQPSPSGSIWLILCCYDLASDGAEVAGICPHIINNNTGEVVALAFSDMKKQILSAREKEILRLIMDGKPSKQIADLLNISIHTVNRHRQNILEKLSVGNSVEAIMAAKAMKLI